MWVVDLFSLVKSPLCNLSGLSSPKSSKVTPARHCLANYLKLFCFCWSFGSRPIKCDSELCFHNIMLLGMRQTTFSSQCKRHLPPYHHESNIKQLLSTAFWRHFCHRSAEFNNIQILIPRTQAGVPAEAQGVSRGYFEIQVLSQAKWPAGAILGWNI